VQNEKGEENGGERARLEGTVFYRSHITNNKGKPRKFRRTPQVESHNFRPLGRNLGNTLDLSHKIVKNIAKIPDEKKLKGIDLPDSSFLEKTSGEIQETSAGIRYFAQVSENNLVVKSDAGTNKSPQKKNKKNKSNQCLGHIATKISRNQETNSNRRQDRQRGICSKKESILHQVRREIRSKRP